MNSSSTSVLKENELKTKNTLLPVFMKLEEMVVLLIGAGNVGLEKLKAIKTNAPRTKIYVVAKNINEQFAEYAASCENIELITDEYSEQYLKNVDLIFSAVNDPALSLRIFTDAQQFGKLCNSADKPELCHFYLSSVVTKGDLKIAISTNGKSPTMAKRLKEVLQKSIPDQMNDILQSMFIIRGRLKGDFQYKVERLNELTKEIVAEKEQSSTNSMRYSIGFGVLGKPIIGSFLFALFFMLIGYAVSILPFNELISKWQEMIAQIDLRWVGIMFVTGFSAQFVDGMLGMGFGVISTTVLLSAGVNPAIVSSRVHTARTFSSGLAGYSHYKFGNINKLLFKTLVIPGSIGAVIGATLACLAGEKHSYWVRPMLAVYTFYLGIRIFRKAFAKKKEAEKIRNAGWLAAAGGTIDAFAGGGWGSLVTSTLMSKTQNPRLVIGSVCLAEFFVVLSSTVTFFILLQHIPVQDVAFMIIGGLLAAPLSASLAGKLPHKYLFLLVGMLVIFSSIRILWKALAAWITF